jgi:hypothetical protein
MMMRENAVFFQNMFDFFVDGLELALAFAGAYYEIIGEAAYFACIQK